MDGVKDRYKEICIKNFKDQKKLIRLKSQLWEDLTAREYMYNKYSKHKYLKDYIGFLFKLDSTEFKSLHTALIGCFKDWIYETLQQDKSNLEDLKKEL